MLRILLADDHAIIRAGLRLLLLQEYPSALIEEVTDAETAIKKTITDEWDVILCDLSMPGKSGLDVVHHVKNNCPQIPILILSIYPEEQYAIRAIKAGADGYLNKGAATQELSKAVQRILQGRKYVSEVISDKLLSSLDTDISKPAHELLSEREFTIFKLIADGNSITHIANILSIGMTTVSTHRARILLKMNLKSNADLTRYAIDHKLI